MVSVWLLSLLAGAFVTTGTRAKECRGEYWQYYNCLHQVSAEFSRQREFTDAIQNQLENDVRQCYQEYRCSHPWHDEATKNARRACFNVQRGKMRQDLLHCVNQFYDRSFSLPAEAVDASAYSRFTAYANWLSSDRLVCDASVNRGQLFGCVRQRVEQRSRKLSLQQSFGSQNQCQAKQARCDRLISDECYEGWTRRVRPGVRDCVNKLSSSGRLAAYRDAYARCAQQRSRFFRPAPLDPLQQYFQRLQPHYGNIPETCARPRRPSFPG